MFRHTLTTFLLLLLTLCPASAQRTPEQMGGVYHAYPHPEAAFCPDVPAGYRAVYLSHYGRHGSRWLPSQSRYEWVLAQFADERNLTRRGRRLKRSLRLIADHARGHAGALTPVGERQQRAIACRMAATLARLLGQAPVVEARSSVADRCRRSMEAFAEQMRADLPQARLHLATDSADMSWMSYDSPDELLLQRQTDVPLTVPASRLMATLYVDPAQVAEPERLLTELHTLASDMQDVEGLDLTLYPLFTADEMEAVYRQNCEKMWLQNGSGAASRGIPAQCAARLWHHIVSRADEALAAGTPAAHLRFGHDTALYRLLSLLGARLPMTEWGTGELYRIVPMAANLQMVFVRNAEADVLVAFYLNELPLRLALPAAVDMPSGQAWYRWTELKQALHHYVETQRWKDRLCQIRTMVGTDYAVTPSAGRYGKGSEEHGQTLPAVLEPHGHTFWTPQTRASEQKCEAPYYYADSLFQGLRGSHWLVGGCTQDYGSFTLMPMTGTLRLSPRAWATPFSHADEESHPHAYQVRLPREHLTAEMTGRSHTALLRFTAHREGLMHVAIRTNSDTREGVVRIDTARNMVWGYNPVHRIYQGWGEPAGFSGWFAVRFSQPVVACGVTDSVAYVTFRLARGEAVMAKAASSFCDLDGALRNMEAEIPGWDFLGTRLALDSIWRRQLQAIDVESPDEGRVGQLYGALYRCSFLPHVMSDVDGRRPRFASGEPAPAVTYQSPGHGDGRPFRPYYGDFSLWDIYRAQMPLLGIIDPQRSADMLQSLVTMYEDGGWMPIFPCWNSYTAAMIGDHAASLFAGAVAMENLNFDVRKAYEGARRNAFERPATLAEYRNGMGRRALTSYLRYGYIPVEDSVPDAFHTHEQVSRTLEYAYDDYCLATLARHLYGQTGDERYAADETALWKRSDNWRRVFHPHTGWVDGRHQDGRWLTRRPDLTSRVPFITEGAVAHYSFMVPHDVAGLVDLWGGDTAMVRRLDQLFGTGGSLFADGRGGSSYWHGNEPCHHIPYLYCDAGQPWKTQRMVHHILTTEYLDLPGGLSGNDDAGQMSAWYIFSALGFYPVCPGGPMYVIGTPMFDRARIGRLVIEAPGVSDENIYIQSATWNGSPLSSPYLSCGQLIDGGTLRLEMGPRPNTEWGAHREVVPAGAGAAGRAE